MKAATRLHKVITTVEYKIDIEWLFCGGYSLATMAICMLGLLQTNRLVKSVQHIMSFPYPRLLRVGTGMISSCCLACTVYFALDASHYFGYWMTWLWNVPMGLLMTALFAYIAGPQDISIDLDTRTCYRTIGWKFHCRRNTYPLAEASYICLCFSGQAYYVYLVIGGPQQPFMLAWDERKNEAVTLANQFADKLHLPVKEVTPSTLRQLG